MRAWHHAIKALLLVAAASCGGTSRTPVETGKSISVKGAAADAKKGGGKATGLEVLFVTPVGGVGIEPMVSASFSLPMKELAKAEDDPLLDGKAPLAISPAVGGELRWLGSRTVTFAPAAPLPHATRFTARVPAGLRSLGGKVLEKERAWEFETAAPEVVSTSPETGWSWLGREQAITLYFNQRVDPGVLKAHTRLLVAPEGKPAAPHDFTAARGAGKEEQVVVVKPAGKLPANAQVTIAIDGGFTGSEGPIPMGAARELRYSTYGPLFVHEFQCGWQSALRGDFRPLTCEPGSYVVVKLTNRVETKGLEKRVHVVPAVKDLNIVSYGKQTEYVELSARWRPGTTYTLSLSPTLKDEFGQAVQGPRTFTFTTTDYYPSWHAKFDGTVVERSQPQTMLLPVSVLNVETLEATVLHVPGEKEVALFLQKARATGAADAMEEAAGAVSFPLGFPKKKNVRGVAVVDLAKGQRGSSPSGLWALRIDSDDPNDYETHVVRVTDIGLGVKRSRAGGLVWATSLATGAPLAGAGVTVRDGSGGVAWSGTTGAGGTALVPAAALAGAAGGGGADGCPAIFVSSGDDFTYADLCGTDAISPWEFEVPYDWRAGERRLLGTIITDRGAYRPGEKVRMKGVVRFLEGGKLVIPAGRKMSLAVTDSRGEEAFKKEVVVSPFGSFSWDYPLSTAAPTGYWNLELDARGDGEGDGGEDDGEGYDRPPLFLHKSFRVEEYRAPSFKVTVTPAKSEIVTGQEQRFSVSGEYLFGGAMPGSEVDWDLLCYRDWFSAGEGWEGYSFEDDSDWWRAGEGGSDSRSGGGELDGKGTLAEVLAPLEIAAKVLPADCVMDASVTSPDRQKVAGKGWFFVHTAAVYPGLAVKDVILKKGDTAQAGVVALDAFTKKPVAGRKVEVKLYRRTWQVVESEGMYEDYYVDYEPVDKAVGSCSVVTQEQPVPCALKVVKGGEYVLKAAAADDAGNEAVSSVTFWASGGDEDISWWSERKASMELTPDKKVYAPGDTARILVQSPFASSEALVTIEREGVIEQRQVRFDSRAPVIEVPVTGAMLPNVYVSVAAVRGRIKAAPKGGGPDPGKPAVRIGYVNLPVGIEGKKLAVSVATDRKDYRPGDTVTVDVAVKDGAGKGRKGEVTLFAVDEAVLMLTGFALPDLEDIFWANRSLGVANADSRMSILQRRKFGTQKGDAGGGGGMGLDEGDGGDVRKLFETTAYYNPSLVTGDDGRATVSFALPDNLTTFRVMAVAQTTDDSFGKAQAAFKVAKPLLVRPALPRFARAGDAFEAGVVVHAFGIPEAEVEVAVHAEGIAVAGNAVRRVVVPAGGAVEATFPFAAEHPGTAVLRFEAKRVGGKEKDAVEWKLPVKAPAVTETVATYGETTGSVLEGIADIEGVRPDAGGLSVRLASTAFVGLDEAARGLVEYPYGCSEQKTSRLVPMVALEEIAKEYGMDLGIKKAKLEETISDLQRMQQPGGGWGYWADAQCPYPWVSAYVLWGLEKARGRGYTVDPGVIDRGAEFLAQVLRDAPWCPYVPPWWQGVGAATKAFIVYVLADIGRPDASYGDYLYEHRQDLPIFTRILLADALYLAASKGAPGKLGEIDAAARARIETLLGEVLNHVQQTPSSAHLAENLGDDYAVVMYSDVRSTAMALGALLDIDPGHFLVGKLVRWIMESRGKDGTWGTTQNNAYALLALSDYWKEKEKGAPDFVASILVGDSPLLTSVFKGRDLKAETGFIPMGKLAAAVPSKLVFSKEGDGVLYYAASLSYALKDLPEEPVDRGIYVERAYYPVTPAATGAPQGKKGGKAAPPPAPALAVGAGASVIVKLTIVTTGKRTFVVVEDPVPAGLEVVNPSFETTSLQDAAIAGGSYGGYGNPWWGNPFYHSEIYDDRFLVFADEVQPGIYYYSYLARATTKGKFVAAPAMAQEMYQPEVFGRTGYETFTVK